MKKEITKRTAVRVIKRVLVYALLALAAFVALLPYYWMLTSALKQRRIFSGCRFNGSPILLSVAIKLRLLGPMVKANAPRFF